MNITITCYRFIYFGLCCQRICPKEIFFQFDLNVETLYYRVCQG